MYNLACILKVSIVESTRQNDLLRAKIRVSCALSINIIVVLNAFNPTETGHETSQQLLAYLQERAYPIVVPTLLLPEAAAAIGRGRGDADLARAFVAALRRLPHLVWVPLDEVLAGQAADVAAERGLRGSDAVYLAVALRFGSTLITLDREQRERVASAAVARYPSEMLEEMA